MQLIDALNDFDWEAIVANQEDIFPVIAERAEELLLAAHEGRWIKHDDAFLHAVQSTLDLGDKLYVLMSIYADANEDLLDLVSERDLESIGAETLEGADPLVRFGIGFAIRLQLSMDSAVQAHNAMLIEEERLAA